MPRPPVDVVVPVYNGHDATRRCLESVVAHTTGEGVRLVVADDASPDPRIPGLLAGFAARDPRVTVLRRPRNLGFVRNSNEAMRQAPGDVVLLNSDTEVPPGWLERLRSVAHSSRRVGSVTPLSNNATICSVPQWLGPNHFPPGVGLALLDEVARASGTGERIEIPTSVGFCVYYRRDALDACGLFDEDRFGAGYGEENDLACRMRDGGYLNLLCDTLFVWHEGGVSFAESGGGDLAGNLDRLAGAWPRYHEVVRGFIRQNPLWGVQSRFGLELLRRTKSPRRRILYLVHNRLWAGIIGGTELHAGDLIDSLGERIDPVVLSFDPQARGTLQWRPGAGTRLEFPFEPGSVSDPYPWVGRLLDTGIDLLHVQHPMRTPLPVLGALLESAHRRSIPIVWTLHDYFALCPGAQLLDAASGAPCTSLAGGPPCPGCEDRARRLAGCAVSEWRDVYRGLLGRADALITPSAAAREILAAAMPELRPRFTVRPHGVAEACVLLPAAGRGRHVAVLGYGGRHKGDDLLERVIEALDDQGITWHLFGRERFGKKARRRVVLHGTYRREELPGLLAAAGVDLVLLLSPWAETYSYTLSEAWRLGLPVVGSDLGAIGERIRSLGGGITVDPWDPAAVADALARLLADPAALAALRRQAAAIGPTLPTPQEMADEYQTVYRALAPEARAAAGDPFPVEPDPAEMQGWMGSFRSPLRA
ncbi:MAG: glycosyltransferase [Actinobacteria bacterium]|nr:glycosyltransferase [Actinomycetota bacterium]